MQVLLGWHASDREIAVARDRLPNDVTVTSLPYDETVPFPYGAQRDQYLEAIVGADAVVTWTLPTEVAAAGTSLRYVAWLHSGCDRLPFDLFRQRGILLTNVPEAHQPAIAEHAWALLLACAKRIVWKHQKHRAGEFVPYWREAGVSEVLIDRTLTLVGVGGIGRRIAKVAKAFGMRVVAVRANPDRETPDTDVVVGADQLGWALGEADYIMLAAPSTRKTRGMIDEEALASVKPSASLINVARGDLVNESALKAALDEGRLASFASDVWWDYEDAMPPDQHFGMPSRLGVHLLPNVVISGDQASNTFFARDTMLELGLANLSQALSGATPEHVVDLGEGY